MFTDSHCHLDFPELQSNLTEIRSQMDQAQVSRALCIGTTLEKFPAVHALATMHANFWATVGVHPDNDPSDDLQEPTLDDLIQRANLPRVVGIGETGLDYYRLGERTTRAASADTLAILREEGETEGNQSGGKSAGGVFHCFTETAEVARAALDMGFYISFSGILTFKTAQDLRDVAAFVPMDRILIETDSPYLAPVPYRGKTNNPSYVPYVAQQIATIKGLSVEEVGRTTSANFDALFTGVLA
ncbi:MAG: TatD family hydrolase [Polaromonas sp.]|nr:TatD family hydrolase [Polaromonas sp.]